MSKCPQKRSTILPLPSSDLNARRDQLQNEFLVADLHRVAGIMPALIARHDVEMPAKKVDDFALALIRSECQTGSASERISCRRSAPCGRHYARLDSAPRCRNARKKGRRFCPCPHPI